eukprot:1505192-Heterocapsa_arctica.AAC.1
MRLLLIAGVSLGVTKPDSFTDGVVSVRVSITLVRVVSARATIKLILVLRSSISRSFCFAILISSRLGAGVSTLS